MGGKPKARVPHKPAVTERVLGYRAVQVYAYVGEVMEAEGVAPSYGMICARFDMDRGNCSRLIASLERRGLLSRVGAGRVRRIRLS